MLVCKAVSAWGHDLSTNAEQAFNRRAGWQSCLLLLYLFPPIYSERCELQTTERKCTAYEYQEGSVWNNWYDASFTYI